MYKKIMVPVDLVHADKLALALDTAANLSNGGRLATHTDASVFLVRPS
jgi:nucleotide-binding universal stress UspA family protein